MDPDGTVRLLGVILAGAPSLPGAACRGRWELFDDVPGRDPERHAQQRQRLELAAGLCRTCAAWPACPAALLRLGGRFLVDHC
ncbi:MAG TPA: hypothetical protein VK887_07220 [Pseudonocardiaceae bacterium]|nr:hypothetical protein [Pseudonocardiaceae bacterium]